MSNMLNADQFKCELDLLATTLKTSKNLLITAPGTADGDSIGSQLALRRMILNKYPNCHLRIINDEKIPDRYTFLPDIEHVDTPETYEKKPAMGPFDIGIIVDGGIDRAGRVQDLFKKCPTTVFIDHHIISAKYPYTIRIVEPSASATTELIYHLSQTPYFQTPIDSSFSQQVYLGLIFDTGFFRHSNTTPEVMELGAKLLKTGFDFTRVGERGMLERSFSSLKLLSYTLSRAELRADGQIIWSSLSRDNLKSFHSNDDDREGIIDHLFLTHGIEVAVLFFELPDHKTKISLRSHGFFDVAKFARHITEHGGGHMKAAGALIDAPMEKCVSQVLEQLEKELTTSGPRVEKRNNQSHS